MSFARAYRWFHVSWFICAGHYGPHHVSAQSGLGLRRSCKLRRKPLLTKHLGQYAMFCNFYRVRSARRNSREVAVSKAASAHSSNASTARMIREGTDTAKGMSAQHRIVATNLGTLTLPTPRSLKA